MNSSTSAPSTCKAAVDAGTDASKTTLPRPLVVENRPGAGGTNAAAYAMGRPPDGYTILFGHAGSTILTPTIGNTPNLKWDAFEPVARIQGEEEFLFLRPGSQWKTIDEVAAFAKQNPGKFRVGGSAVGTGVSGAGVSVAITARGEALPAAGGSPPAVPERSMKTEVATTAGTISQASRLAQPPPRRRSGL